MKNGKRIAAIAAIVLLLAVFALPMVFALSGKEFQMGYFFASLAAAFFISFAIFAMMEIHRIFVKNNRKNKNPKIDNIIFDVGQVLLLFNWKAVMDQFHFPKEKRKKIEYAIFGSHIWDERDRGLYPEKYYVDQMVALAPEYEEDIREFMRRSPECISKTEYALTWVKYLKKQGYHLYILSNFCEYMIEGDREYMDFLSYMDGVVFSAQVKELKPEDGIYRKLLDLYHLDPAKSVFLDDRQENLDGAARFGIHTILFRNFKQAAAELEERFDVK